MTELGPGRAPGPDRRPWLTGWRRKGAMADITLAEPAGRSAPACAAKPSCGSLFTGAAMLSLVISALIVYSLVREAWTFIVEVEWSTVLLSDGWFPRRGLYDVRTLLVGSLDRHVVAMAVAGPLGLGAAIYLSEYATPRVRRILKPVLEIIAGIPSVVLGFFVLTFVSPEIVQGFLFPDANQFNLLGAGLGVGILTIPLVASVARGRAAVGARRRCVRRPTAWAPAR